jgi:hypothetical protein
MAEPLQPAFDRLDVYHLSRAATTFPARILRGDARFQRVQETALADRKRHSATIEHPRWKFQPLDAASSWIDVQDEASFCGVAPSAELERVVTRQADDKRNHMHPAQYPARPSLVQPSMRSRPMTPADLHRRSLPASPRLPVAQAASPTSPMSLSPSSLGEHEFVEWLDPFGPMQPHVSRSPAPSIRRRMTDASAPAEPSRSPEAARGGSRRSTLSTATPFGAAVAHLQPASTRLC